MNSSDDTAALDPGYLPVLDDLAGATAAADARHAIARMAFMRLFLADDRVARLFDRWRAWFGADSAVDAVRRAADIYYRRTGLDWRDRDASHPPELEFTPEEALVLKRADLKCAALFSEESRAVRARGMAADAVALVKNAGLDWAWLPVELIQAFWLDVAGRIEGRVYTVRLWSAREACPAELHFSTLEGESLDEALERLLRMVEETARTMDGDGVIPGGRSVSQDTARRIERDVEWLYLTRVRSPREAVAALAGRLSELARERDANAPGVTRKTIYDAIGRATDWLSTGRFALR